MVNYANRSKPVHIGDQIKTDVEERINKNYGNAQIQFVACIHEITLREFVLEISLEVVAKP